MSDLDLATLDAALSSIERATQAAIRGELVEAEQAMERAEKRLASVTLPWHSRRVRKVRDALQALKEALRAPKLPNQDAQEDGIRPRAQRLSTALRACASARA